MLTKIFPGALNPDEVYARLREPFGYWNSVGLTATRVRRGRSTTVFGMARPAAPTAAVRFQVQFRARGAERWSTRKRVTVGGPRHYFQTRLRVTRSGYVRILWRTPPRAPSQAGLSRSRCAADVSRERCSPGTAAPALPAGRNRPRRARRQTTEGPSRAG